MPDDTELLLRPDPAESPAARRKAPRGRPEMAPQTPSALAERPRSSHRSWLRWALFLLLPIALIAGGYWYVTGGQVMSTDDAYVEADKVGVSTDVSGIVKEIDVTENQHVETGWVLYRLDDLPFRLALERAEAQVGMIADALNALKANYRDMQAQIQQAQHDVDYYDREFRRQQILLNGGAASQVAFDTARRNLRLSTATPHGDASSTRRPRSGAPRPARAACRRALAGTRCATRWAPASALREAERPAR